MASSAEQAAEFLSESYPVNAAMCGAFDTAAGAGPGTTTYLQHRAKGETLGWGFSEVLIGGRMEKRMYLCWHDASGAAIDPPTRFPSLDLVLPVGPVKRWFVQMTDVLRYAEDGAIGRVNQKVVWDWDPEGGSSDPRFGAGSGFDTCFRELHAVLNKDRCTFLAANADTVAGTYLSKAELKYIGKHGPKKGAEWLLEHLEDPNNRSHHTCRFWCPKSNLFVNRRAEGEAVLKVCPADRATLDDPAFDLSGKIEAHLNDSAATLSLRLMPINMPFAATDNGNVIAPGKLGELRDGAVASLVLRVMSLYKRPTDDQHTVTCSNAGTSLLTNGPEQGAAVATVDYMAELRALKRPRTEVSVAGN